PVLRRELRHLRRGTRDWSGDSAAGDAGDRDVGHPHPVRQPAAAGAGRGRDLVELPGQRAVLDADVDGVLPLGQLAQGEDAGTGPGQGRRAVGGTRARFGAGGGPGTAIVIVLRHRSVRRTGPGWLCWLVLGLAWASPLFAAGDGECTGLEDRLTGAWLNTGGPGFFEAMSFSVDGQSRRFDSWLHDRPDVIDATCRSR